MPDELETDEKNIIYRDEFVKTFNLATILFYRDAFEPEEGKMRFSEDNEKIYRRPASDLCVNYCLEKGIRPKCHCLNADVIPSWEVTNETIREFTSKCFYQTKFYYDDFVEWSFRLADRYFPQNKSIINDYTVFEGAYTGNCSPYCIQIEHLNDKLKYHC